MDDTRKRNVEDVMSPPSKLRADAPNKKAKTSKPKTSKPKNPNKGQTKKKKSSKKKKDKKKGADKKSTKRKKKSREGEALRERLKAEKAEVTDSEEEESLQKWVRTKKRKRSKLKTHKEVPVYVVDEHDGTMVCMLRAIEEGYLPSTNIKLFHFDSHPDLGTIPEKFDGTDDAFNQKYSIRELYDATDIATFITPMCLMNHVNFVVWACGFWCDQFNPGTWKLLVGKDKNDGCIKIAAPGNKKLACLEYWESGGSTCKVEDFEYYREWTLMVVRYGKNCKLPQKQYDQLCDEFESGTWVLDIDEDFFSCNNPYFDEFRDMFGEKMHKMVSKVYNYAEDTTELEDTLMAMFRNKSYKKSWSRFQKTEPCKDLLSLMTCSGKKKVLKDLHAFLRKNWPEGGMDDDEADSNDEWDGWDVKDFFTLDDLHRTGQLACLPHHISTAKEIKTLMNEVDDLLGELPEPSIICVATSRLDRYLPDSQAQAIHGFIETMLMSRYGTGIVHRLDKQKYSVDTGESTEDPDNTRFVTDICSDVELVE